MPSFIHSTGCAAGEEPSLEEVRTAIQALRAGSAPGDNGLATTLLKKGDSHGHHGSVAIRRGSGRTRACMPSTRGVAAARAWTPTEASLSST